MNVRTADVKRAPKITERQMLRIALATFDQVSIGIHKRPTSSCATVWEDGVPARKRGRVVIIIHNNNNK